MDKTNMLERYRAVVAEQKDYLTKVVPQRSTADASFDFRTDEAYVKRENEINSLYAQIQAATDLEKRETAFDRQIETRNDNRTGTSQRDIELRNFHDYLTTGNTVNMRSNLASNGTTTGGYAVPTFISDQVIQGLAPFESVRRAGATVYPIQGNTNLVVFNDASANFIGEASTITATDPTVGRVQLTPNLLVCKSTYSWQLGNRFVGGELEGQLVNSFTRGIGTTENVKFLTGSGSGEPGGAVTGSSKGGNTAASATTFTFQELVNVWYALDPRFQQSATWIMSTSAASIARTLESSGGMLVWQDNLRDGVGTLMGRPVIIDTSMAAVATGTKPVIVGDFSYGYAVGEEKGLAVLSDPYTNAGTGEVAMYAYKFVDGKVVTSSAIKHLLMG